MLARDEEPEPTTQESMFNYMRLSDGGSPRHTGPLSEIHVIAEIAQRVLQRSGPIDWNEMKSAQKIRESLAKVVPGLESLATIGETKQEFQIPGRTFHTPTFPTPSGRAQIKCHELPSLMGAPGEFRLMTIRSEGQFNTVVYEDYDLYRNIDRRDVILMHPEDLQLAGLFDDQRVVVKSAAGEMVGIRTRAFKNIRPGNVMMYYPEANILVPRSLDPRSKTPAFKAIPVTIKAL